jgi:hypothetical protein
MCSYRIGLDSGLLSKPCLSGHVQDITLLSFKTKLRSPFRKDAIDPGTIRGRCHVYQIGQRGLQRQRLPALLGRRVTDKLPLIVF